MRKILTFLLAFLMISSVACAEEITFRGIPWGSSMSKVEESFDSDMFYTHDEATVRRWENITEQVDWEHLYDYPDGWECLYMGFGEYAMKVAGYDVIMSVACRYGIGENNEILKDKSDSVLCSASYTFDVIDYVAAYDDLKVKLTSLYGDGIETTDTDEGYYWGMNTSDEYHTTVKVTTWVGENDTEAKLYCSVDDVDDPLLQNDLLVLYYGKTSEDENIERLQKLLHVEALSNEQESRNDDTSGL